LQFLGERADVAMLVLPLLIRQKGTAKPKGESAEKKSISDFVEILEVSYFVRLYSIRYSIYTAGVPICMWARCPKTRKGGRCKTKEGL
jgi:hypothetical protein